MCRSLGEVDNLNLEHLLRNTTVTTTPVHVTTMHVFGTIIPEDGMLRPERLWLHVTCLLRGYRNVVDSP
jgi:hypothetical protein